MKIDLVKKITKDKWVVKYSTPIGCCGLDTQAILIEQKEKPTQEEIENAIRNIRK